MLSSSTFILHSRPRGIAINIAAFFLLLVDALSHPLPRGTLSFAGAEIGATAGEISLQSFTTRNRLSISSGFLCSAPLISRQGLTTNTALGQPPTWPSSLFRRGIKELALPTASASAAPATPSPSEPVRLTGSAWFAAGLLAIVLILLTGLLAGLTMGVMSVDMTRLRVWTRTGSEERRAQASAVFAVRRHPNWLLTTLILSNVAISEGLPLCLNHLFAVGALLPFVISTILVILFGQLIPQAIVPLYVLSVASRMTWFLRVLMILTSPFSIPIGWCFRWCKVWGKRKQRWRADGVLDREELGEFVRLHQQGVGLGGVLDDGVGAVVRRLIEGEGGTAGQGDDWELVLKVDEGKEIDAKLLASICEAHYPFLIVGKGVKGSEGVVGAVLREKVRYTGMQEGPVFIRDLPIHSIPIIKENCKLMALAEWLMGHDERVALVVSAMEDLECGPDGLSWTSGGRFGDGPQGPVIWKPVSPLGVIDSHFLLRRFFLGGDTIQGLGRIHGASWSESSDSSFQPRRNALFLSSESLSPTEPVLPNGLRKRSNPPRFGGIEDEAERRSGLVGRNPLANRSNSQIILAHSDSSCSQAQVVRPDPTRTSMLQPKISRSRDSAFTSDAVDHRVREENHARSQSPEWIPDDGGSKLQVRMRNLSRLHSCPSSRSQGVSTCTQSKGQVSKQTVAQSAGTMVAVISPRRHASTGDAQPRRREDATTRLDKRYENFTDPEDDELVNEIIRGWQESK